MNDSTTKTCTKCGQTFPATLSYFYKNGACSDGLHTYCKQCHNVQNKRYKEAHLEEISQYQRDYRFSPENKEKKAQHGKAYYQANKERITRVNRVYVEKNRAKLAPNKSAYGKKWREENRELARHYVRRRRARRNQLPDTFTVAEWHACLEYFHHTCAVCGSQLRDLFGNIEPHADHWIPISHPDCTGTIAKNMVCLCAPCNHQKSFRLPRIWLEERYGKRKATEILKRVEAYFNSLE